MYFSGAIGLAVLTLGERLLILLQFDAALLEVPA